MLFDPPDQSLRQNTQHDDLVAHELLKHHPALLRIERSLVAQQTKRTKKGEAPPPRRRMTLGRSAGARRRCLCACGARALGSPHPELTPPRTPTLLPPILERLNGQLRRGVCSETKVTFSGLPFFFPTLSQKLFSFPKLLVACSAVGCSQRWFRDAEMMMTLHPVRWGGRIHQE